MKSVFITGAREFLGSALALQLVKGGYQINLLGRSTSVYGRLKGSAHQFNIGYCGSDSEILNFLAQTKPDVVIHTACSYVYGNETSLQTLDANVRFGVLVMQGLVENGKNVSFINTGTVLSSNVSLYALAKNQFLSWGKSFSERHHFLKFINVRLQHMYGPGDDLRKFITHVINACHSNASFLKLTTGNQKRDFVYIDDVVSAYKSILINVNSIESMSEFDIGSGVAPTIKTLVETVHALTNSKTKLLFGVVPYRANEEMYCVANIERIATLGWKPEFDLLAGLTKTIEMDFPK